MAARFWVTGGTGNWNSTTNWSATTGGASGASVPGSADTATFNASSGSGTATLDISPTVQVLTMTGFTGTLAFGTNTISLNSTGTIFTGDTTYSVTGTPLIICTDSSATSRVLNPGAVTELNSISFRIIAGTGAMNLSSAGAYRNLDFTDGVNPTGYAGVLGNSSNTIYGNFKASTGMTRTAGTGIYTFAATSGTKTINAAGVAFDNPFTFNGVGGTFQLQAALISGSTRTATLTNGTLDLNGYTLTTGVFNATNTNVRTLAFNSGKIVLNQINTTIWTSQTATNFSITGTSRVEISGAGTSGQIRVIDAGVTNGTEANSPNFYVTAGSDNISFFGTGRKYGTIDFSNGNTSTFTGNFQSDNFGFTIYGNLVLTASVAGFTTSSSFTGPITFGATSGTKTITSAGKTSLTSFTFNGIGGTWAMQDALTIDSARTLTLTNGTLKLAAGTTSTVGSFVTSGTNQKYLQSSTPGTQATISDASGVNSVSYLTIQDINATGGATWNSFIDLGNINVSNNTGWDFYVEIGNVIYTRRKNKRYLL